MLVAVGFLRRILRMDAAIAFWRLVFDPAFDSIVWFRMRIHTMMISSSSSSSSSSLQFSSQSIRALVGTTALVVVA
jgi:hypothetical protein